MAIFYILIFVFGLIVGSFLNCVIYRLEEGKSFIKGRSYCPHCKHELAWYDLIPVLSYAFLKGKCRYCKKRISIQYPAVETATAMLFLLIFNFQFSIFNEFTIYNLINLCLLLIITSLLIIIFVFDLKHFIIPDSAMFSAIGIAVVYQLLAHNLVSCILPAICASGFFLAIFLASKGKWIGFGDVKLGFFMGMLLGSLNTIVALYFAFTIGAIIGIGLILAKRKKMKSEIPFGPFLIIGTLIAFFWGNQIVNWYLSFLL